jgi:hypothetical protein
MREDHQDGSDPTRNSSSYSALRLLGIGAMAK